MRGLKFSDPFTRSDIRRPRPSTREMRLGRISRLPPRSPKLRRRPKIAAPCFDFAGRWRSSILWNLSRFNVEAHKFLVGDLDALGIEVLGQNSRRRPERDIYPGTTRS